MEVKKQIYALVSEIFKIPENEIQDNMTSFQIKEWDSLNQLRLITAIETKFGIVLEAQEIFRIVNIKSITQIVSEKLNNEA